MHQETALRTYFESAPRKPDMTRGMVYIVVATLLFLVSVSTSSGSGTLSGGCAMFFAAPAVVLGLWGAGKLWRAWAKYQRQLREAAAGPQDEEVQTWLDQGLDRVKEHALSSLGLTDDELVSDPLMVVAPVVWSVDGISDGDLLLRTGSDGCARFGVYSVATIALTERHLCAFRCEYSFVQDRIRNEKTCEYHYGDIVSVSTREEPCTLRLPSGKELAKVQEFRVSIPSGEAIRITVDVPEIRRMAGVDSLPTSGAEKAVRAIRAMLRQKKP